MQLALVNGNDRRERGGGERGGREGREGREGGERGREGIKMIDILSTTVRMQYLQRLREMLILLKVTGWRLDMSLDVYIETI